MDMTYFFFTIRENLRTAVIATIFKTGLLFKAFCYKIKHSDKERSKT